MVPETMSFNLKMTCSEAILPDSANLRPTVVPILTGRTSVAWPEVHT